MQHRIFIRVSDIQVLTGFTYRQAYNIMQNIKCALGKEKHQRLAVSEYCKYEGVGKEEVMKALGLINEKT